MEHNLCIRINFECINGKECVSAPGHEVKYLDYSLDDTKLDISISDSYKDWKRYEV
jgi:hypothetical protein